MTVYINASHSSYSPGGVWKNRSEHKDALAFSEKLRKELSKNESIRCVLFEGKLRDDFSENDIVLSFHRDSNMKNCCSYGAKVLVKGNSDAGVQYDGFRLLEALCSENGFRYKGVHTFSDKWHIKSIEKSVCPNVFVFFLGYIDSERDNRVLDGFSDSLIKGFAAVFYKIIKERKNEADTAFSEIAFRGM